MLAAIASHGDVFLLIYGFKFGVETTSEDPFVESEWFAPSSLIATSLEKKVAREYAAKSYELAHESKAAA